ncbi:MAG: hypothetical protein E3J56_05480 [Candidatus Aminicenantes bacterium]|nr:MAG: hypothetical protein E3J56_05480 [Candidatus Aminicenantes bacterium]
MARLRPDDVRVILQTLEDGINLMPKLDKMDRIRVRSKIRKQYNWLSTLSDPNIDTIFHKLEERLSDVFSLYPFGFSDQVKKILAEKLAHFRSV